MTTILKVHGREILDSRGNPTVEVDVALGSGARGRAAVPSGASTGTREAVELRDGDKGRFAGKGVRKAVAAVNGEIAEALRGRDALDQIGDRPHLARTRRHRQQGPARRQRRPWREPRRRQGGRGGGGLPLWRYVGGGRRLRAAGADDERHQRRRACRQPDRRAGVHGHAGRAPRRSRTACAWARRSSTALKKALKDAGHNTNVGDEGGFAPNLPSTDEALAFLARAVEAAGYRPGRGRGAGARRGVERVLRGRPLHARRRRPNARCRRHGQALRGAVRRATRSSRSRTAWPRATGTAGRR